MQKKKTSPLKKANKIDTKKVGLFLRNVNPAEYNFLQLCMQIRNSIETLSQRHELSKKEICNRLKIKPAKHNDFIKGCYNYKLTDTAELNALYMELETEMLEKKAPFRVTFDQNKDLKN